MDDGFWTFQHVAAPLLIASTLIPIFMGILLAVSGNLMGLYSGPEDIWVNLALRRWVFRLSTLAMLVALFGLALLTTQLHAAGEQTLSTVALVSFVVAAIGWILEMTVTLSIGEAATKAVAESGVIPDYWTALNHWVNNSLQQVYVSAGLVALMLFGRSLLQSNLSPSWAGWFSISWGALWLIASVAFSIVLRDKGESGFIPAVVLIPPLIIGIGLLT